MCEYFLNTVYTCVSSSPFFPPGVMGVSKVSGESQCSNTKYRSFTWWFYKTKVPSVSSKFIPRKYDEDSTSTLVLYPGPSYRLWFYRIVFGLRLVLSYLKDIRYNRSTMSKGRTIKNLLMQSCFDVIKDTSYKIRPNRFLVLVPRFVGTFINILKLYGKLSMLL